MGYMTEIVKVVVGTIGKGKAKQKRNKKKHEIVV